LALRANCSSAAPSVTKRDLSHSRATALGASVGSRLRGGATTISFTSIFRQLFPESAKRDRRGAGFAMAAIAKLFRAAGEPGLFTLWIVTGRPAKFVLDEARRK